MDLYTITSTILVSTVANLVISTPLIYLLFKYKFYKTKIVRNEVKKKRNKKYYKFLEKTLDTPSSYGILLLANLTLILLIQNFLKLDQISSHFITIIIFTIIFLLLGLADDITEFFFYLKKGAWGIKAQYKLIIQLLVSGLSIFILFEPALPLLLLGTVALTFIINSYNITDGLDGLVGGPSLIIFLTYLLFELLTLQDPWILLLYSTLIGFHFVFLYFNINPARVFLGNVGALPLGFLTGILGFRYPLVVTLPLLAILLFEGFSSFIQIASIKLLNKKVFLIAPFHLHLLNKGWSKNRIVSRTWILQGLLAIASLWIISLKI